MPLSVGDKLGPYKILAPIGKGGMGEVYRAKDTKLDREVAIKVLPSALAQDPERLARFEREAKVLASLNHSNIAQIYGIEESSAGRALVMELVPGETLKGTLPLETALNYAKQIAEALEAAHDKGIIHRDLKPANIMVTPAGVVKILDFGLAAVTQPSTAVVDPNNSPTLTMGATQAGMILGTAGYMAPEQAAGQAVDKRVDIWAFGVVLYEMLTGKRLFSGDSIAHILADVLRAPIDFDKLPKETPRAIRELVKRCLDRDAKTRLRDIGEARIMLAKPQADGPSALPVSATSPSRHRWLWPGVAALAIACALGISFVHLREVPPVAQSLRYQISTPGSEPAQYPALSPDGRNLAFVTSNGGSNQVWIRTMGALDARPLAGTDGATYPFWSPDATYLGFFAGGKLKKIAIAGGSPQTLCDATSGRGGAWNRDDLILFSPAPAGVILRVSAAGGTPVPVIKFAENGDGIGYRFPVFLPDGSHFLYQVGSEKPESAGVFVGSLDGNAGVRLLPGVTNALFAPPLAPGAPAHLLFRREDTLMAQPFDAPRLKTAGDMFPIAEQVPFSGNTGFGAFSVSENGILVYRSGVSVSERELIWMDRAGKRLGAFGKPGAFGPMAVSPDDKTLAVTIRNSSSQTDIWLQEAGRGVLSRFTFRSGLTRFPVWSPDGGRLIFGSTSLSSGSSSTYIYEKPAGGTGREDLLLSAGLNGSPDDWSPDGESLVYEQTGQKTASDLWLLPLNSDHKPKPYLQTPFDEMKARFSPDGKWMAYQSNESGQFQVYVQTVPISGAKYQISTSGGTAPRWRRDGSELFYVSADQKLMAVPIKLGKMIEVGTPQQLFPISPFPGFAPVSSFYEPSRDGQRFLVNAPAGGEAAAAAPFTAVTNWQAGFKK